MSLKDALLDTETDLKDLSLSEQENGGPPSQPEFGLVPEDWLLIRDALKKRREEEPTLDELNTHNYFIENAAQAELLYPLDQKNTPFYLALSSIWSDKFPDMAQRIHLALLDQHGPHNIPALGAAAWYISQAKILFPERYGLIKLDPQIKDWLDKAIEHNKKNADLGYARALAVIYRILYPGMPFPQAESIWEKGYEALYAQKNFYEWRSFAGIAKDLVIAYPDRRDQLGIFRESIDAVKEEIAKARVNNPDNLVTLALNLKIITSKEVRITPNKVEVITGRETYSPQPKDTSQDVPLRRDY